MVLPLHANWGSKMAVLATVSAIIAASRILLQDQVDSPYRYADSDLLLALNEGLMELRRIRPDLMQAYFGLSLPTLAQTPDSLIPVDEMYRMYLVYYVCGQAQLRDDENTQDSRAGAFLSKATNMLTSIS